MSSNILDSFFDSLPKIHLSPAIIITTVFVMILPFIMLFLFAILHREEPPPPPIGCRKYGLQGKSNLSDQYSKIYGHGGKSGPRNKWRVKAIFIYPLKSCSGVELEKGEIIRIGMKYDRQFTLAQQVTGLPSLEGEVESEWNFITQRTVPRLAKVETELWVPDPAAKGYSADAEHVKSEGCIIVRFPFSPDVDFSRDGFNALVRILAAKLAGRSEPMVEFRIPFNPSKDRIRKMGYKSEKIKIWKDTPQALNLGCEIPEDILAQLKYTLGVSNPLTLFRIDTTKYREVYKCAPKKEEVGFQTIIGMNDSYPLHIMNLASVHDVASRLPKGYYKGLTALRYRANVYLTGPPAFSEDNWAKARIGGCTFHISCRTTRCKLPNVDPATGIRDQNEPERTMRNYRIIDRGSRSACLGMQVTPITEGEVRVGDEVQVLEETDQHYFLKV